jgi:flagellar motor protein MotB
MARTSARSWPAEGMSTLALVALAFGAAGFGFGTYFYLVPFQRKAAQLDRAQKELRARGETSRPRVDVRSEDPAARRQADMKALQARIQEKLAAAYPSVTVAPARMVVRFPEEKIFEARGPWLSRPGQESVQALGQLLADRARRVVISAPMGAGTVPRWVREQLPTPADLAAARAGNALKTLVKGGARAPSVLAVVGALAPEEGGAPVLELEIEL